MAVERHIVKHRSWSQLESSTTHNK